MIKSEKIQFRYLRISSLLTVLFGTLELLVFPRYSLQNTAMITTVYVIQCMALVITFIMPFHIVK